MPIPFLNFSPFSSQLAPLAGQLSAGHERVAISGGERGTEQTIELMQQLVAKYKREDAVREIVGKILNGEIEGIPKCPQKDYNCYAKSIYTYFRDKIMYAYDPHLVEYLERPKVLLKNKIGDCDSKCVAMNAALESIGIETQFVTIKSDPNRKDEYSHVYSRANVPKVGWVVIDATMPTKYYGWEPEAYFEKRYWHGSSDSVAANVPLDKQDSVKPGLFGMSGLGCNCKSSSALRGLGDLSDLGRPRHRHGGGWGWGGGFYPMPYYLPYPVPTNAIPTTEEVAIYSDEESQPSYDVGPRGALSGLSAFAAMGASTNQNVIDILSDVYNGTAAKKLDDAEDSLVAQTIALNEISAKARSLSGAMQASVLAKLAQGRNAVASARAKLIEASGKYNNLVSEMNRVLPASQQLAPTKTKVGLVGLGFLPAVIATDAAVFAGLALAFAAALSIAISALSTGKSIIQDVSDTMRSAGVVIQNTGDSAAKVADSISKLALVAGLGVLGYLAYKHRGDIQNAFKKRARA